MQKDPQDPKEIGNKPEFPQGQKSQPGSEQDMLQQKVLYVTFTKVLSQEAIEKGIRVNAVAPGPVWTPLILASMPEENVKHFGEQTPLGRPAQPVELSPIYVFLASKDASAVFGQIYGVTAGEFLI